MAKSPGSRPALKTQGAIKKTGRDKVLDLDRYVPALITFIANKLSNNASAVYRKRFGLNVTEWRILSLLAIEPGISASRICEVIGFDKGPVSRTLAVMEERDLILLTSDPTDGRSSMIFLTDRGHTAHDKILSVALERERKLLSCLKTDEQETLIRLLKRVHDNVGSVIGAHQRDLED